MEHAFHVPHPHLEKRKQLMERSRAQIAGFNNRVAVLITNIVGTMWCAYAFAILALVSFPEALAGGKSALIAWIAQTFLQLVLLSIIMVGQKVASQKSDRQLEQTYLDAEALLQINDDMHNLLKQNHKLTEQIDELMRRNTELVEQINKLVCH